jgi:hypothetical protein
LQATTSHAQRIHPPRRGRGSHLQSTIDIQGSAVEVVALEHEAHREP